MSDTDDVHFLELYCFEILKLSLGLLPATAYNPSD